MQFGPSLVIRAFHRIRFGLGSSWGRASSSGSTSTCLLRAFAMVPMQPSVDHGFVRSKIESTEPHGCEFVRKLHPYYELCSIRTTFVRKTLTKIIVCDYR